jgi:2-(3-amino-3-carboxypropyl)histidine synthase
LNISNYSINIEKTILIIKKNKYKNIAIQLPEGIKNNSKEIIEKISNETKSNVFLFADPCYGACDIPYYNLKKLDIDLLIHIGHTKIPNITEDFFPIIYLNAKSNLDISKVVKKSIKYLEGKKIGIVTTAQHINDLKIVKNILKNNQLKPILSKGDDRVLNSGQILGCNYSSALNIRDKIDSYLYIGTGFFHPIGLALNSRKPVISADPSSNNVKKKELEIIKNKILKQRFGAITISKKADNFGILIGLKPGQMRIDKALYVKKLLDSSNKTNYFIAIENFSDYILNSINYIDCFISTSCPRIAIDDYVLYKKPIITPIELEIVLNKRDWNDYEFDQIY